MRLDHLLSMENGKSKMIFVSKVRSLRTFKSLFNFEGAKANLKPPDGGVAQLGEHLLCKQGVSGSIPLISTR